MLKELAYGQKIIFGISIEGWDITSWSTANLSIFCFSLVTLVPGERENSTGNAGAPDDPREISTTRTTRLKSKEKGSSGSEL